MVGRPIPQIMSKLVAILIQGPARRETKSTGGLTSLLAFGIIPLRRFATKLAVLMVNTAYRPFATLPFFCSPYVILSPSID